MMRSSVAVVLTLAALESGSGTLRWAQQAHGAESLPYRHIIIDSDDPTYPHCKAVGDIDGDGFADVLAASAYGQGLYWYAWFNWTKHRVAGGSFTTDMQVGDVDQDGDLDVVVGEHNHKEPATAKLHILENADGTHNGFQDAASAFLHWLAKALPQTRDYNVYHNAAASPRWQWDGVNYDTFTAHQQAAGELHSRYEKPRQDKECVRRSRAPKCTPQKLTALRHFTDGRLESYGPAR